MDDDKLAALEARRADAQEQLAGWHKLQVEKPDAGFDAGGDADYEANVARLRDEIAQCDAMIALEEARREREQARQDRADSLASMKEERRLSAAAAARSEEREQKRERAEGRRHRMTFVVSVLSVVALLATITVTIWKEIRSAPAAVPDHPARVQRDVRDGGAVRRVPVSAPVPGRLRVPVVRP